MPDDALYDAVAKAICCNGPCDFAACRADTFVHPDRVKAVVRVVLDSAVKAVIKAGMDPYERPAAIQAIRNLVAEPVT